VGVVLRLCEDENTTPHSNLIPSFEGMTDNDYAALFVHLVLPILWSFKPDLILIASGFDAVQGDLIGDCGLSTLMYYRMTRSLIEASPKTPIVVALEGGYNVEKSAECMEKVALALLDESPIPGEDNGRIAWTSQVRDRKGVSIVLISFRLSKQH
jgi:acetoin utilization deacetylase AcuC-like enzyme